MKTTISNQRLQATIDSKGAELTSLKDHNAREFMWQGDPQFWGKHSPVLFPIVGTLKNNRYHFEGKTYELPRHGFARELEFQLVEQSAASVTFALCETKMTLKVYPFLFELRLVYTLRENTLEIRYEVINKDSGVLYFCLGAHPAFALDGDFEAYSLATEKAQNLEFHVLENDLLSDKTGTLKLMDGQLPLRYSLFENDALVFKSPSAKALTLLKNQKPILKVYYDDFHSLGIWTKQNAGFICLEPWFGYADTLAATGNLTEKEGLVALGGNSQFDAKFLIEVF